MEVASADDYYVSLSGSNVDSGTTKSTAWRTIDYAVNHVSAGDTIFVIPGNYGAEHVTMKTSGTASNPIKITRYGNSGMITLKHDIPMKGDGIDANGNYWIVEYFDISDYNVNVVIHGDNNIINFVTVHGDSDYGFAIATNAEYNVLNECLARNINRGEGFGNGFRLMGDYNLINNCIGYDFGHFGISIDNNPDNKALSNTVEGGVFYDIPYDTAIAIADATDTTIKNVQIYDVWQGIRGYDVSKNLTVINCTIYNTEDEGISVKSNGANISQNIISHWGSHKTAIWSEARDVIFSENEMQGSSAEYRFHKRNSNSINNTVIKNPKSQSFEIKITGGNEPPIKIEYTNGRVFEEDSGTYEPHYFPEGSTLVLTFVNSTNMLIKTYDMTAIPASGTASVRVNKFDISLLKGNIIDFKADTTNGNWIVFTIWNLKPGYNYVVKRDDVYFANIQANSSGYIQFKNSEWSDARKFTIKEPVEDDLYRYISIIVVLVMILLIYIGFKGLKEHLMRKRAE